MIALFISRPNLFGDRNTIAETVAEAARIKANIQKNNYYYMVNYFITKPSTIRGEIQWPKLLLKTQEPRHPFWSDYFGGRNTIAEAVDKEPIIKANIRTQKNNSTDKDDMSFFISKLSASRDRNTIANKAFRKGFKIC